MVSKKLSKEDWARLRVLWESDPTMSQSKVAALAGVSQQAVQKRIKAEGWRKVSDQKELANRAHDRADAVFLHEQAGQDGGAPVEQQKQRTPNSDVLMETAVALRAKIIERHRKEWDGARNFVYKAIQQGDFEKAKLGKITAEAIKIIQDGERKAWGLDDDRGGDKGQVTVVIERKDVR